QAVARPLRIERALLRLGEAALAQDEAADLTAAFDDGERLGRDLGAVAGERIGHASPAGSFLAFHGATLTAPDRPARPVRLRAARGAFAQGAKQCFANTPGSPMAGRSPVRAAVPRRQPRFTRPAHPPERTRWRSACAGCGRRGRRHVRPGPPASSPAPCAPDPW